MNSNYIRRTVSGVVFAAIALFISAAPLAATEPVKKIERPLVEMVFVLDTTSSMSGLIEGAKQRIWGIVNEMLTVTADHRPEIRIGLVAFRDKGDAYVTKVMPLTSDLDKAYTTLMDFQAEGGGDTEEDVRQGLADGLTKVGWMPAAERNRRKVAQIMFLVGDAPPHDDYKDEPDTIATTQKAIAQGIYVNTIQCGVIDGTAAVWQNIARHGEGKYFAIAQDGGVETISTPYDAPLAKLGGKIGTTYLAYGGSGFSKGGGAYRMMAATKAAAVEEKVSASVASAPTAAYAAADRAVNKAVNVYAYDAETDLLTAVESGAKKLNDVKDADLPDALKKLPPAARKKEVEKRLAERKKIREDILALSKKRDAYLIAERKKRAAATGKKTGFDTAVAETIKKQTEKRGIKL